MNKNKQTREIGKHLNGCWSRILWRALLNAYVSRNSPKMYLLVTECKSISLACAGNPKVKCI